MTCGIHEIAQLNSLQSLSFWESSREPESCLRLSKKVGSLTSALFGLRKHICSPVRLVFYGVPGTYLNSLHHVPNEVTTARVRHRTSKGG